MIINYDKIMTLWSYDLIISSSYHLDPFLPASTPPSSYPTLPHERNS